MKLTDGISEESSLKVTVEKETKKNRRMTLVVLLTLVTFVTLLALVALVEGRRRSRFDCIPAG